MIAWLVVATVLGILAGLATHACADAADPEKRQLRVEFERRIHSMADRCDESIRQAYVKTYQAVMDDRQRLEDENQRLAAVRAQLTAWSDDLQRREAVQTALDRINKQLEFINKRLDAVDGGYGFLLGHEEDPT